jgi:hypothetical protein
MYDVIVYSHLMTIPLKPRSLCRPIPQDLWHSSLEKSSVTSYGQNRSECIGRWQGVGQHAELNKFQPLCFLVWWACIQSVLPFETLSGTPVTSSAASSGCFCSLTTYGNNITSMLFLILVGFATFLSNKSFFFSHQVVPTFCLVNILFVCNS